MNEAGIETAGDVVFVGTTREEGTGSLGGMKDFLQDNPDIDISLSIDNNDMSGIVYQATIGETWEVTFSGTGGHAFGAFGTIAQPIHAAARAVAKIADIQVPAEPKTTTACPTSTAATTPAFTPLRQKRWSSSTSVPTARKSLRS